jgi:hypothetical protein
MLPRNDVIYLERGWMKCRGQSAVLTTGTGPLPHLVGEISVQCA